jgi:hypothetical protein
LQMLQPEGRSAGSKPAYAPNVHKGSLRHLYVPTYFIPTPTSTLVTYILLFLFIYLLIITWLYIWIYNKDFVR